MQTARSLNIGTCIIAMILNSPINYIHIGCLDYCILVGIGFRDLKIYCFL